MNQNITMYIQVAASVRDESTLQRELAPLTQIRDSYPKLILLWTKIQMQIITESYGQMF